MFLKDYKSTAFIYKDKEITYKELKENIDRYKKLYNLPRGSKVAIFSENRPEWIYAFFASWEKGMGNVLIDYLATAEEAAYIIEDAKPEIIFTSLENLETLKKALEKAGIKDIDLFIFEDIKKEDFKYSDKSEHLKEDETAVYIYTSGTTGKPKGVMLTIDNFKHQVESIDKLNIVRGGESLLTLLPFHHAYALSATILVPLTNGARLIFIERLTGQEIIEKMQKYKIDIIVAVPRIVTLFHKSIMSKINSSIITKTIFNFSKNIGSLEFGKILFSKVHKTFGGKLGLIVCGGAKLDVEVAKDFWAMGFKISEGYGITEAAPIIAFNSRDNIKIGSVGKALENVAVKIVDNEIVVKGQNIMKGYYKNPEETAEVIKDGWFYTGDTGNIDENGYIYITGRKKEIIVLSNGKNINPDEVEGKIIGKSPIIKEIAVFEENEKLKAIIYPDFDYARRENVINIEETIRWNIIDKYNMESSEYKKIYDFIITNVELPKTRLGKIKRFELKDFMTKRDKKRTGKEKEPENSEYLIIKKFLEEITKKDIAADDHIELDVGLDSLDKVELLYFVEKTFGLKLKPEEFAKVMILREFAKYISEKKTKIEETNVEWQDVLRQDIKFNYSKSIIVIQILKAVFSSIVKKYFNLKVIGQENIPKNKNFVIAVNHQSYMDAFLIGVSLNERFLKKTYFVAKEKHVKGSFQRFLAINSNVLAIDINKDIKEALQRLCYLLRDGNNLVIFPEGARSRTGDLGVFKKSFAILAKECGIPVVPIVIKGAYKSFPIGAKIPKKADIEIEILKPVETAGKGYDEITKEVRKNIESALER